MRDKAEIIELAKKLVDKFDLQCRTKDGVVDGQELTEKLSNYIYQTTKVSLEERKEAFKESLKPFVAEYGRDLINNFWYFWSNVKDGSYKMAFEKEKTWNLAMRLNTWQQNKVKFNAINMVNKLNK